MNSLFEILVDAHTLPSLRSGIYDLATKVTVVDASGKRTVVKNKYGPTGEVEGDVQVLADLLYKAGKHVGVSLFTAPEVIPDLIGEAITDLRQDLAKARLGLIDPPVADLTRKNMREDVALAGDVSVDEATEILQRFINSHFRKDDRERARFTTPANPQRDDDIRMGAFIARAEFAFDELEYLRADNERLENELIEERCKTKTVIAIPLPESKP